MRTRSAATRAGAARSRGGGERPGENRAGWRSGAIEYDRAGWRSGAIEYRASATEQAGTMVQLCTADGWSNVTVPEADGAGGT